MMRFIKLTFNFFVVLVNLLFVSYGQENKNCYSQIDSLIQSQDQRSFNGAILITQNGKTNYSKTWGYSDLNKKIALKADDQFVIGSISKQFTAVLVLREFEKGKLTLHLPIRHYLPELTQSWADSVTVHHLLTHLHGITDLDKPCTFKVGSQFAYSQIGYDLLAKILEKVTKKSFAELSQDLFATCGMMKTFHPDVKNYTALVKAYTETENGDLEIETESLQNYPAAGSFISTLSDLDTWNKLFYNGKLLKKKTMKLLKTKQEGAVRNHPIFGVTEYGYGITIDTKEKLVQYGQTGFAPGFVSMSFYFPKSKTSVIVLENIAYNLDDFKTTFFYHTEILKIVRNELNNIQ